jgi:hypothetical protein
LPPENPARFTIATRYDKTAASFSGTLYLAAAFQWLS